ncbi:rhamnogalacturonase E [Penicillium argentinense]|uniref:Rhamnogalacturonase E n=1 Tax=Penicillium argentinense TaxID=1131581 RepID=A0A9W9FMJ1_9EURO|nr:rhamnogalacturonase E [Penicillium argentinense]KAJ5102955.1 rhamnogalacturonase E [Penicillium argentinense]
MTIRGADHGGLDGIGVTGTNIWIHDISIMATNKDECVTTKNILIENAWCNISGGRAMGSLGSSVNITNMYLDQMFMIDALQGGF